MTSLTTKTDEELIAMVKDDVLPAFDELYNRYWSQLLAKSFDRLKHKEDAEEVVQELFVRIWRRRQRIDLQFSFKTYIYAALRYEVMHFIARQQYRKDDIPIDAVEFTEIWSQEEQFHSIEIKELQQQMNDIIDHLPEKCQIIFKMSRDDGFSARKIADLLNLSPRTVETQIGKAIRILRKALKGSDSYIFLAIYELFR
ncbi:RNA polymerase sigma-70 factor [Pedobacter sp. AW31-3R]|uniref:RNA polymerase sigma-70 factor n=1 Tax=Pedobacter sp. AW31-3R TaxID=3445781 RepID=UPI003FA12813